MNILELKYTSYFEKNMGQFPSNIKFKLKTNDYITFFTKEKLVISLPSNVENTRNVFYIKLENTNHDADIKGEDKQQGVVNYFKGNNKSKWINKIPIYSKIKYENIYEGIDVYYYINDKNLEYDFVLSKEANPKHITISFEGVDDINIDEKQDIVLTVGDIKAKLLKPQVYQMIDNIKTYVECKYILDEYQRISFLVDEYDKEYELILDPIVQLDYSTYIGGINCDFGRGIAVDNDGYAYITGYTDGNYPVTTGQITYGGGSVDGFVTKLSPDGSHIIYSTYLGGSNADYPNGIVIDSAGCAYVAGRTESSDFPTMNSSYQTTYGGNGDVFVTKLNSDGSLLIYSTYIGQSGSEEANGIAIDNEGCVYLTGKAENDYPVTIGAYQTTFGGQQDAFVTKLDANGQKLIYSTYIGGISSDCANAISIDNEGYVYITGYAGEKFPTTKGAYQIDYITGERVVFVSKISIDGSSLIYSTYIGSAFLSQGNALAVDSEGCVYIAGNARGGGYPIMNPYQGYFGKNSETVISKISKDGSSLIYSTYFGGKYNESAYGIAVDSEGYAYITGCWQGYIFLTKFSKEGNKLISSSTLNSGSDDYGMGITLDSKGYIYIAGYATNNYMTTKGSYQESMGGGSHDVVVTKILLLDYNLSLECSPAKAKLLDVINTKLIFKNLSMTNVDINIKYQPLDSSISFIQNSLYIQGVSKPTNEIPKEIYLSNILYQKTEVIELDLKYIKENLSKQIPITVITEIYDNKSDTPLLLYSKTTTFYINTAIGANYIPGCNNNLYNLAIKDEIQTTDSSIPIIYYKSGTSYIYIEPSENSYVYKVRSNSSDISEIPIKYI